MALESWEITVFQLAVGSLVSGFILVIFSIFTAGFHFGHINRGTHVGHFNHSLHLGHLSHVGHLFHFGHHAHVHVHAKKQSRAGQSPETPIILILAVFLLMFGAIGTVIYKLELFDPVLRILLSLFLPIVIVKVVSMAWNRTAGKDHGIQIPMVSIDNQVITLTNVDDRGGLVLADTGNLDDPKSLHSEEKMKMQAKTLAGVSIDRDTVAYIIDIDSTNTLIIDLWPKQVEKKGKMPVNFS